MGTMNRPQAPTAAQLQREVDRVRDRKRFQSALCRTLGALALIAACVAAVVYMAPVLRVRGTSMSPTLSEGDVLVALRGIPCGRGDIAAFDDGTHILVKRIIAGAGDVVDIGATLDERIGDGFYFARSLKLVKYIFEHPELLDQPLSEPSGFEYK